MAAWPIRFLTGARSGKRPHAPDLNGEDTKRNNSVIVKKANFQNIFYYFSIL
jgi:hypothetical protein